MSIYLILFSIVLLTTDQLSKLYVAKYFSEGGSIKILPFLNLYYSENYGIAFSFFQNINSFIISLFSFTIMCFMLVFLKKSVCYMAKIGYIMIFSGAMGNLIDRVRLGYVIDFIYFHINDVFNFAIFNFADSFITIGVIIIFIQEFFYHNSSCK